MKSNYIQKELKGKQTLVGKYMPKINCRHIKIQLLRLVHFVCLYWV